MQSCTVTWLNDTHTRTDAHTLAAKVSAVSLTHGDTISRLLSFWHGITHGRTRLLHKPAHRGTLEAWSYLTSAMFFRLVMTGQLLEAKWGGGQRGKTNLHISPQTRSVKDFSSSGAFNSKTKPNQSKQQQKSQIHRQLLSSTLSLSLQRKEC